MRCLDSLSEIPVFYLVHIDGFLRARNYFFRNNPRSVIALSREMKFLQEVGRYVSFATERGKLVVIRENPGLEKELLTFYEEFVNGETSVIVNDFSGEKCFDEDMQRFVAKYENETGLDFSSASQVFAGFHSEDCLPTLIQSLISGKGYAKKSGFCMELSPPLLYTGKKIEPTKVVIPKSSIFPELNSVTLNNERGTKRKDKFYTTPDS